MKKGVFPASSLSSEHGATEEQDEPGDSLQAVINRCDGCTHPLTSASN